MKIKYVRISTKTQNTKRQLKNYETYDNVITDVISGGVPFKERPRGEELWNSVKNGDVKSVSIDSICRLGRNLRDILKTIDHFNKYDVNLIVDNLGLSSRVGDKHNFTFNLIVSVVANIAEMERETLRERQLEGIAIAKKEGRYKGRVEGTKESDDEFLSKYPKAVKLIKQIKNGKKKMSLRDISLQTNLSVMTIRKIKKRYHK